jgi:methylation protein EvaC
MRYIILGKTGMLGTYLYSYLRKQEHIVIGVGKKELTVSLDYYDMKRALVKIVREGDIVINCIGLIPQKSDVLRDFMLVNSQFPLLLSIICETKKAFVIQPSTDCVFNGKDGMYRRGDSVDSKTYYGNSKIMGEITYPNTMIIRTSIIGDDGEGISLMGWVLKNRSKTINGYTNHFWNGVTCLQYAKEIESIVMNGNFVSDVVHITSRLRNGDMCCSKYKLLTIINEVYDLGINIIPVDAETKINRTLIGKDVGVFLEDQIKELRDFKFYMKNCYCRVCDTLLDEILDFGYITIAGAFHMYNQSMNKNNELFPFTLGFCKNCYTILCQEIIPPDILFKSGYFYRSSQIPFLLIHFREYASFLKSMYGSQKKILEIGCNDGVFLRPLKSCGFDVVGVDPADNVTVELKDDGFVVYNDYIENCYESVKGDCGKFDIVVASNCLAHTPNIKGTFLAIKDLLKPDGYLYIEVHYGGAIFGENQFDFLYHEHMTYYTVSSFYNISLIFDMTLENVYFHDTHGKSMRICMKNSMNKLGISRDIQEILDSERNYRDVFFLKGKASVFNMYKNKLAGLYEEYNLPNYIQYAYGASGRANTICSYCDLKFEKFIDDAPSKIGGYTPYYNVLIYDSSELYKYTKETKVLWILAWPYTSDILMHHKNFKGVIVVLDFNNLTVSVERNLSHSF